MFSIGGGYTLTLSDIVTAFLICFLVSKGITGAFDFVLVKLNKYHKSKSKDENIDSDIANHSTRLDNIEKALNEIKEQNENINKLLDSHEKKISNHDESLNKISDNIETLLHTNKIQYRHSIVRACEEYLSRPSKEIESKELEALTDMYITYTDSLKGNSYAKIMYEEVKKQLTVVTKYDADYTSDKES